MGDRVYEYWERGALKQYSILQKNVKKLRKEKWFAQLYDNAIYSTETMAVIFTNPYKTMLEQEGSVVAFQTDEQLQEQFTSYVKDHHMEEMVRTYGLDYAEKLTGHKRDG